MASTNRTSKIELLRAHAAGVQCPVERAIHIIGGRWKLLILRLLLLEGAKRYNELLRALGTISAKELTRNLRELEELGLIARDPPRAKNAPYALTAVGAELGPAFESLIPFGEKLLAHWTSRRAG